MSYLDIYNIEGGNALVNMLSMTKLWLAIFMVLFLVFLGLYLYEKYNECDKECDKESESLPTEVPLVPTEVTPVEAAPVEAAPVEAAPVEAAPVEAAPVEAAPVTSSSSRGSVEGFTNDLPYQEKNVTMKLSSDDDYSDVLQKMSLDNNVFKQHNQYVTDRNKITSTASYIPARSDTQDIVTSWGLTRRSLLPKIDSSAREVPSQDPEQGSKPIQLRWN
jgi:hypothetical protein